MLWLWRQACRGHDWALLELLLNLIPTGLGVLLCVMAGRVFCEGYQSSGWALLACGSLVLVMERFR